MARVRVQDSLAYSVYRCARVLRRHFMQADGGRFELTQEQWFVLNKLSLQDGRSQTELTEDIFADRPNLTRILTTMEKRGWIRRAEDPEDARRIRVFLTEAGRALEADFTDWVIGARDRIFDGIEPEELEIAKRVLARMETNALGE